MRRGNVMKLEMLDQIDSTTMNRRSLLKRAGLLGLTLPAAGALLSACGTSGADMTPAEMEKGDESKTASTSGAPLAAAAAPAATGGLTELTVTAMDLKFEPAQLSAPANQPVRLTFINKGAIEHDIEILGLTVDGLTTVTPPKAMSDRATGLHDEATAKKQVYAAAGTGDQMVIEFTPTAAGSFEFVCLVPGHKEAGMVLDIQVAGAPATSDGGHGGTAAPAGDGAVIDWQATPGPDWEPFDPKLEPAPGGTEHDIEFSMTEEVMEVAPGVTQEVWVFNGQFPGPTLRGKVGDIFTVTLTNDGEIGHSLDFHASKVAWDDEMRTLQPGESLVYQFQAKHAGVWMYHCGTAPALHHIGNGMFGAVIIDPPDLAPADHEFIFVQSELYLGPEGEPGDLGKMQEVDFDAVVFNGYANQYQHAPLQVETGERVRAYVLDAGPSENSAFHIVGTIFDTVFKEGTYLLRPDGRQGGAQALDLQPSQGGFVEFTFDEDGLYLIVTHKFSNVGIGALGIFAVGDVDLGEVAH